MKVVNDMLALNILNTIKNTLDTVKLPAITVPPLILSLGAQFRPGISPKTVASNIISRQSEAGAPYGPNTDGSANIAEAMEVIRVEEIMKALKYDAQIQIAIPPGSIQVTAVGASAMGPVTVQGSNVNVVSGYGIIQ